MCLEAVVLAGGLGTRLRPVVADRPKPMALVKGRPFLEYLLDYWIGQGVGRFVLSVGYLYEVISDHFGASYRGIPVRYAIESSPLGTGGGLMQATGFLEGAGPLLVVNGDTYFPVSLSSFLRFHRDRESKLTMGLREVASADRYGTVALGGEGQVLAFHAPGTVREPVSLINGGVYLFERDLLEAYHRHWNEGEPVALEKDLFGWVFEQNAPFYGTIFRDSFIDIGIPSDYERCQSLIG